MNSQGGGSEEESDPVFQDENGLWNFWDGTGAYFYGPYESEHRARAALAVYLRELHG